MKNVFLALEALHIRHQNLYKSDNAYDAPMAYFKPAWPSECILFQDEDQCFWRAKEKSKTGIFRDLEKALEINFHQDLVDFYSAFWANGFGVERDDINFNLIQTWNEEDEEQLLENILGHCFAKLKARLPLTVFIGSTHGDDVISILNESGEVVLEKPGRTHHKTLAPTLESFLLSLSPNKDKY